MVAFLGLKWLSEGGCVRKTTLECVESENRWVGVQFSAVGCTLTLLSSHSTIDTCKLIYIYIYN